ncbi:glycoside hydrolase family 3 N-terminal domain-containing protein [Croceiramulus getboli]|nr:glycoside hydrolase family 3 N-terminal domain-containing protein [Flavobacteriaceae bacterium YJPT1-3]
MITFYQTLLRLPLWISLFGLFLTVAAQQTHPLYTEDLPQQRFWVDSTYNTFTLEQKLGQLFMVRAFSNQGKKHEQQLLEEVQQYHVGGIIFSNGGPYRQAKLNNRLQKAAKVPLMIGMDAEWGLAMRLDSTYAFPYNMTLGAIKNLKTVEEVGYRIGRHCDRLGVHINFAPVVDINTNPDNPIIGNRSFGSTKENVTQKALALMKGMHQAGILTSAKHFPGHGDTDSDSHKTLPTIRFSRKRLDSVELYPFRALIDQGVSSVMAAHLNVPALEQRPGYPSSISKGIITDLLKKELGFDGLIFTDALEMKGLANFKDPGEADLAAFLAGNDILLISEDVPKAVAKLKEAYYTGAITEERLAYSVKKILYAKYKLDLNNYQPVSLTNLHQDLNSIQDELVYRKAIRQALTVIKNEKAVFPIKDLEVQKIAYVHLGDDDGTPFFSQMRRYADVDRVQADSIGTLLEKLEPYNYVVIGYHKSNANPWKSYSFSPTELDWLNQIAEQKTVLLDIFTRPYAILNIPNTTPIEAIVLSYQNSVIAQELSAQLIFGAFEAQGKLPVELGASFPAGLGYESGTLRRLGYSIPEAVGVDSQRLKKVDSLVEVGLKGVMYPGAQVLIARRGKVIYEKSFGYHTYNKKRRVDQNDIYDLASMTKILGTLPLLMELHSKDQFDLDDPLGKHIPDLKGSNKSSITFKQALSHYGRFKPWIPFYLYTLDSITKKPSPDFYRKAPSADFNIQVASNLYLRSDYRDSIFNRVKDSDLRNSLSYRYSDLPYYLMKRFLEDYYGSTLDQLSSSRFYQPMGATRMGYNPLDRFNKRNIVPSENDNYWRMEQVHGRVHDMGAAMQDNVGGHAGLFGNANDVAKMMQMYLQNGYYGGKRYFSKATMEAFNNCYYCEDQVRRGVGFDKPQLGEEGPTCGCVSMTSFGHSGFTGTYTWADPQADLIYVFLSNRTFPTMENRKLITSDLRTKIQGAIYEALLN